MNIKANGGMADSMEALLSELDMSVTNVDSNFVAAGKLQWDSPFGLKLAASLYIHDGMTMDMQSDLNLPSEITGGLSGLTSRLNGFLEFDDLKIYVLSAEYMTDRLTIAGEYTEYDLDFGVDISSTLNPEIVAAIQLPPRVGDKTTMQGYYGSIAYRILDQLEVGAYYSEIYYDKSDHGGQEYAQKFGREDFFDSWLKDFCLSTRYDFSTNWCGKIEVHLMDGTFMTVSGTAEDWELYTAKVTYSF